MLLEAGPVDAVRLESGRPSRKFAEVASRPIGPGHALAGLRPGRSRRDRQTGAVEPLKRLLETTSANTRA